MIDGIDLLIVGVSVHHDVASGKRAVRAQEARVNVLPARRATLPHEGRTTVA